MFKQNFWQFFQSFLSFLKHRLVRHRTSLLLLLLGVFLPLQIFGELAEDIWENEGGFSWDVPILLAIHQIANPKLDILVVFLTKLGVFWGVVSSRSSDRFDAAVAKTMVLVNLFPRHTAGKHSN